MYFLNPFPKPFKLLAIQDTVLCESEFQKLTFYEKLPPPFYSECLTNSIGKDREVLSNLSHCSKSLSLLQSLFKIFFNAEMFQLYS